MIYVISGKVGAGKTYYCVKLAKYFLERGVNVYSNILIDFKNLKPAKKLFKKYALGTLYYWNNLEQFIHIDNGIILFDEAASVFEPRLWYNLPYEHRIKFQQHRKDKLDIYLTAQNFNRLDIIIRQLTNFVIEIKYIKALRLFIAHTIEPQDYNNKKPKIIKREMFFLNKELANSYNTYEKIILFKPVGLEYRPPIITMEQKLKNNN